MVERMVPPMTHRADQRMVPPIIQLTMGQGFVTLLTFCIAIRAKSPVPCPAPAVPISSIPVKFAFAMLFSAVCDGHSWRVSTRKPVMTTHTDASGFGDAWRP